jgi:disulfide bond formation protein DsbB
VQSLSFEKSAFWSALLGLSITMMGIALFYQYYMDFAPCVLCVHIRVWVILMGLISAIALVIPKGFVRTPSFLLAIGILVMFSIDVYELWQIEAGYKMGSCSWSAGFPEFLPLNEWAPSLFEIGGLCGESPEMIFGITMAQSLMNVAGVLMGFFGVSLVVFLKQRYLAKKS